MSSDAPGSVREKLEAIRRSYTLKGVAVAVLILLLLIPKAAVMGVIGERRGRLAEAKQEVGGKWGGAQTLTGPWISIPFQSNGKDDKGILRSSAHTATFLPESIEVDARIEGERRYRGIFEVIVYTAKLAVTGSFAPPAFDGIGGGADRILWDESALALGISDLRGVVSGAKLTWDGRPVPLQPGVPSKQPASSGIHATVPLSIRGSVAIPFRFEATLRGTEELSFVPAGRLTRVRASSKWPSPSFQGSFLPTARAVTEAGFDATWDVPHLARNFPQRWQDADVAEGAVAGSSFGVRLFDPVDGYQTTARSAKYGVLFLALTFLVFFLFEVLAGLRAHPIQYLLVGFALLLFYLLLLALSEHMLFGLAYAVATASTVGLVSAYSATFLSTGRRSLAVGGLLAFLYGYLFCLLKAEDHALLLGAVGLFLILGAVMYATRKVDWYRP